MTGAIHIPVLLEEVISYIKPKPNEDFIDATLGGGGYTKAILEKNSPHGRVMCFDLDKEAIAVVRSQLNKFFSRVIYINDNYSKLKTKIDEYQFNKICGIVCDLGYSSLQIKDRKRGFSFESEGELDLRYNIETKLTADEILNKWSENEIIEILKNYGEEPLAKRIAREIIFIRKKTKITSRILREIVERVYGRTWRKPSRIHPATRTWQALRIAVNDELAHLKNFLPQAVSVLENGGKLAIVSFHSLEDKIVKEFFKLEARDCVCPKEATICVCHHQASIKILTKKPITASLREINHNPRSRSGKLRVIQKII
jgi:16S rRNA (cytosine1402-N4)-methyltransferase